MSFYRKEQARNVRGFCCPRPLPASSRSPSFHPFSGSFFLPSPFSPTHGSSLLSALSRERWPSIDRSPVFAAIISPNGKCFATSTPLQRSGSTHARDDDLCLLIGKVAWKRRGDTVEGTATKGLEMAENATQLWCRSLSSAGLSSVQHKGNCCAVPECFRASESFCRVVRFVVESIVSDYSLFRKTRWTAQ